MQHLHRPLRTGLLGCAGLGLALISGLSPAQVVQADQNELQRCRALADDRQRLACFDRAVSAPPGRSAPSTAAAAPAPLAAGAAPAAPATSVTPPPAAGPSAAAQFGLPRASADEAQALSSRVLGPFDGWSRGRQIRLANGQVWEVTDGSVGVYRLQDPKVTIQRGFLGSYFMEIEGVQQTPKVRRVR